ncbi:phage portal protein [Comamonas sp. GB3 AK4-5]|uniref:phage portal protein n=1 Tax=Comamonas sp. GB3 AK4-5 TaxID=3231487 RepID=UPI00351EA4D2
MNATLHQRRPGRIRAAIGALLGKTTSISDAAGTSALFGVDADSGQTVDASGVMRLSTAWACVRIISQTIATLPLNLYERKGKSKNLAESHALYSVLHSIPNPGSTAAVFWESMVAAMLLRGAGRGERLMFDGRLVGLVFLNPDRLTPRSQQGSVVKEWSYVEPTGVRRIVPADRVWTVPGFSLDGVNGVSAVQYGAAVFGQAKAAERAAGRAFRNGALQSIYYTVKDWLKKEQRSDFRENVMGLIEKGETPLLEGGTDVKSLGISPKDVQLLESRGWSVQEICRWFLMPPWMVGHTEKSTSWGSGIEQQLIAFLTFCIGPLLRRIEQAIIKDLLTPAERLRLYPKFAIEGLLRTDSAARAAFYGVMVDKGILTRDEVRELEDREPMGGNAAVLTVQSAMTTLDAIGQTDPSTEARAALRHLLGFSSEEPEKG